MSSFYLDIIKDRLYASKKDDKKRRSAQTAMYEILSDLIVMLAPILSFTMEEVYQFMKTGRRSGKCAYAGMAETP